MKVTVLSMLFVLACQAHVAETTQIIGAFGLRLGCVFDAADQRFQLDKSRQSRDGWLEYSYTPNCADRIPVVSRYWVLVEQKSGIMYEIYALARFQSVSERNAAAMVQQSALVANFRPVAGEVFEGENNVNEIPKKVYKFTRQSTSITILSVDKDSEGCIAPLMFIAYTRNAPGALSQ